MNHHRARHLLLTVTLVLFGRLAAFCQQPAGFTLVGTGRGPTVQQATVVVAENEPECVRLAVADLLSDVQKITGQTLRVVTASPSQRYQNAVVIGTVGRSRLPETYLPEARQLTGQWEAYRVQSVGGKLVLAGSDERGTMFAIYHFIEQYLGVDPLYFWADREPQKRVELRWNNVSITQGKPTFQYRGWFINDEDLLTEWTESGGKRNIDYPFYQQVVNPKTMRHVVEALIRLRQNLLIPASFIDIRNPAEAALVQEAVRRGVFVSMHHVEPMGVSAFTFFNYWRAKKGLPLNGKAGDGIPLFSYYSSRPQLEEVWRVYAQEWAKYPNVIWQIGLRGIADRPMWLADPSTPQTDSDRGRLISEAMQSQMQMIREVDKRPNPPITTTLWAEGSVLNRAGHLQIPEGVTVVFSDNSPGWVMQADFHETLRQPDRYYGAYYHHQLWSSGPHWVQIVPPSQTQHVLRQVVEKGDTAYAIANVSNLREFVQGIDATARMVSDFSHYDANQYLNRWFDAHYGALSADVRRVYQSYFDGFAINRPAADPTAQTPILMDGQMRLRALEGLNEIKLQLSDPPGYAAYLARKKEDSEEKRWIRAVFSTLGSGTTNEQTLLANLLTQKAAHQRADSLARQILPRLAPDARRFFDTNLLSHLDLILGLETWLEATLRAKQAADKGQRTDVAAHLQQAVSAFDRMQQAQQRNSVGPKWQHWYRGDKKMNLTACRQLTQAALNTVTNRKD